MPDTKQLPENPLEIDEFFELYIDPKNDYDLGFREGLMKGYQIARDFNNPSQHTSD